MRKFSVCYSEKEHILYREVMKVKLFIGLALGILISIPEIKKMIEKSKEE